MDHITKAAESIAAVKESEPVAEAARKRTPAVNDEIFAQVQKAFDLDDSKRSYVAWYRNNLKKTEAKVPEPVVKK